jgi:hypothetical protein
MMEDYTKRLAPAAVALLALLAVTNPACDQKKSVTLPEQTVATPVPAGNLQPLPNPVGKPGTDPAPVVGVPGTSASPTPSPSSTPGGGLGGGIPPTPTPQPEPTVTPAPTPTPSPCTSIGAKTFTSADTPKTVGPGTGSSTISVPGLDGCTVTAIKVALSVTATDLAVVTSTHSLVVQVTAPGGSQSDVLINLLPQTATLTGTTLGGPCTGVNPLTFVNGAPLFSPTGPYSGNVGPYGTAGDGKFTNTIGATVKGDWRLSFQGLDAAASLQCWKLDVTVK